MARLEAYPPISDYGLLSDMRAAALVSRDGSIDWCCLPRFDSAAVFSRILDWRNGGYFRVGPRGVVHVDRRYLPGTVVLETTFHTQTGVARLTDFMPVRPHDRPHTPIEISDDHLIGRTLECIDGTVEFDVEFFPRFDYGTIVPYVELHSENTGYSHGGAHGLTLYCSTPLFEVDDGLRSEGKLIQGQQVCAIAGYQARFPHAVEHVDESTLRRRMDETVKFWTDWSGICTYEGKYREDVIRSALTLKALTYAPSGALIAAATTSLPEGIGGERNWDYRFTWIRDATFALYALFIIGYTDEAKAFKDWLEWSTVGRARDLQIMYGVGGERRLTEVTLPELEGYRGSQPVRIGNGASKQFQLDIYGEIADSAHLYRKFVKEIDGRYWRYLQRVVNFVMDHWREPDDGIWETRGGRRHFVFSKVMCWVALDRVIKAANALGLPGDVERWEQVRAEIRAEILAKGFDEEQGVFVQAYGGKDLDAANLMLPLVGFIKADDPRMRTTIEAIERELTSPEGFVYRYSRQYDDGLQGDEGAFSICTFWLADNLILLGEAGKAREIFERMWSHSNDLGLFSEQIDPRTGDLLGNFPQAFTHLAFINTAVQLQKAEARE